MANVGLIVDYLYSHTVEVACQIADWLESQGYGVEIHSSSEKVAAAHAGWDNRVATIGCGMKYMQAVLWFVPPPAAVLRDATQRFRHIVVATTERTAKAMAPAADRATAVLCLSESAKRWFEINMPKRHVIYGLPTPLYQPLMSTPDSNHFRLLSASPSHTTMTQNLPRLMPKYGGLKVDLLLRGPGQARRHVKTPRRLLCHKNSDLSLLPQLVANKHLLLWQRQHDQDNIGVQALWMGVPVITNRPIEGLASEAVIVVDDRLLLPTAEKLFVDRDRLEEMRQSTHTGLQARQQQWHQALRSLF